MIDNDTHCLSPSFWRMIDIMPVVMGQIFWVDWEGGEGVTGWLKSWIVRVRCPVKIRDVRPNGQMAKWPDIMSGEKFCVILRPAIYFQKSYIKRNLDGGTSTPEKLCWGISCASLFLPLFRGLNHACENEGFCTISTRTHTGFPVSQILMRKGHKSQGLGHHWEGRLDVLWEF